MLLVHKHVAHRSYGHPEYVSLKNMIYLLKGVLYSSSYIYAILNSLRMFSGTKPERLNSGFMQFFLCSNTVVIGARAVIKVIIKGYVPVGHLYNYHNESHCVCINTYMYTHIHTDNIYTYRQTQIPLLVKTGLYNHISVYPCK